MPTYLVNLDALITREDFEVTAETHAPSSLSDKMKVGELAADSLFYQVLRKPDFQRETANWSPEKIAEFVQSFLDGDLIPSIILWRSPDSGNVFVIDGAHRLSALIAWVHDDYGDKTLSREFYDNLIPTEQVQAAEQTRKLVASKVGSYQEILSALKHPANSPPAHVTRARNLSSFAVQLQWVPGDAKRAEDSFFRINQKATPIDSTELLLIQSRRKPNAVAARALLHAGVGHKYWSAFPAETQREIEQTARVIYDTLFTPVLEEPIKTLDLPVAGRGYSGESVSLAFQFVNFANHLRTPKALSELPDDSDGQNTLKFLRKVNTLSLRISSTHRSSLGLHPAVYFYGSTGRYQPSAFLAAVQFIQELEQKDQLAKFTRIRNEFEDFLLDYKYFTNQLLRKYGSGDRPLGAILQFYRTLMAMKHEGKAEIEIIDALQADPKLTTLKVLTEEDFGSGREFTRDTKSAAFLRDALNSALRCKICGARIHKKSITWDHKLRKEDGGRGGIENAQMAHPYCNTGYKESLISAERKSDTIATKS